MSKEDLKRAEIRSRFKKSTPAPEPTIDVKRNAAISTISRIILDFFAPTNVRNNIRKPISTFNLKQIIKLSEKNKILLTREVINCLNLPINRNNIGIIISYFNKRIEDFFNSQNLLPPNGDPLYQINLLNLCIKVKKGSLNFNDALFKTNNPENQLFNDMACFKGSCELYVWHVKINESVPLNNLNLVLPKTDKDNKNIYQSDNEYNDAESNRKSEFLTVYTPLIGRKCKIVNAPIINPPKDEAQLADEAEGVELPDTDTPTNKTNDENSDGTDDGTADETADENADESADEDTDENADENTDESANENTDESANENTDTNSDQTTSETDQINDETANDNSNNQLDNQLDNTEQFRQYNLDFIKNYNEDDYIYFILVALLLTSLFFIYLRYK